MRLSRPNPCRAAQVVTAVQSATKPNATTTVLSMPRKILRVPCMKRCLVLARKNPKYGDPLSHNRSRIRMPTAENWRNPAMVL